MKRSILLVAGLLAYGILSAQFRYGYVAGGTASYNSIKTESTIYSFQDIILLSPPGSGAAFGGYGNRTFLSGNIHDRYSFHAGAVFDYKLSRGFILRAKVLLDNLGWKEDFKETGTWGGGIPPYVYGRADTLIGKEDFRLTYASIPVNLVFLAPLKSFTLYFGAGAYIGWGIQGQYKVNFSTNTFPGMVRDSIGTITFNNDSAYQTTAFHANSPDLGLSLSAGLELNSGFFIDFSFNNGLKNVLKDRYGYIDRLSGTGKYTITYANRNRAFKLGIGFFIKNACKPVKQNL